MRIVLDTHVLVSGLLSPFGPPGRVLDALLAGDVTLCFDGRIMAEYRQVLLRPKFGWPAEAVERVLDDLASSGEAVAASPLDVSLPDPEDIMFLETAIAAAADHLVTGNRRHFPARARRGVSVLSPAECVSLIAREH